MMTASSLYRLKFTCLILVIAVVCLVAFAFYRAEREMIAKRMERDMDVLTETVAAGLRAAMTVNRRSETQELIDHLAGLSDIDTISVYDAGGTVRLSSLVERVGRRDGDSLCPICHGGGAGPQEAVSLRPAGGEEVIRSLRPIRNEAACHGCHPPGKAMLGVLLVDFSTADAALTLRRFRRSTFFLVLVVVMLMTLFIFLDQAVSGLQAAKRREP